VTPLLKLARIPEVAQDDEFPDASERLSTWLPFK
jgi:hypothetical protein